MVTGSAATAIAGGTITSLTELRSLDAIRWLKPLPESASLARSASKHIFASLAPFSPKSPFSELFVDGFDAEQIWQQIDLQSRPIVSALRREIRRLEAVPVEEKKQLEDEKNDDGEMEVDADEEEELEEEDGEEEEDDEGDEDEEEEEEDGEEPRSGVEDGFFKVGDLERFMEEEERKEMDGVEKGSDDEDEEEGDDDDDDLDIHALDEDGGEDAEEGEATKFPRYEDFFGNKKKLVRKTAGETDDLSDEDQDEDESTDRSKRKTKASVNQKQLQDSDSEHQQDTTILSTHEKQMEKRKSKMEKLEKANLEPRRWAEQGEVTASRRPKNSALEEDLDFELKARPPPIITEEITTSLEDLIMGRIREGLFDDVPRTAALPSKGPKDVKELDENKSQKGLAEVYEEEYMQKTGIAPAAPSFKDELKKEANLLFKRLCLKLDALSHFHFAPKPVIEDMSVQTNLPALAIEEVAPLAVSDAAMLAPEELFAGKGDIKEETELTQVERKRRRAKKKRKYKAEQAQRVENRPRNTTLPERTNGGKD